MHVSKTTTSQCIPTLNPKIFPQDTAQEVLVKICPEVSWEQHRIADFRKRGQKHRKISRTLVVQKLFSRLSSILCVRALHNSIHRARFLAESTIDALGHVDIVAGSSARSISTLFSLNGDGLSRANLVTLLVHHSRATCIKT